VEFAGVAGDEDEIAGLGLAGDEDVVGADGRSGGDSRSGRSAFDAIELGSKPLFDGAVADPREGQGHAGAVQRPVVTL